ncbi:PP2C family serine/threonine-protein phosphatase [Streptomyces boncukensis]|uniref:Serine/threonine-protein phosphatase n=1 Tax=Streptomyces boncukensis TaxID=2711219 RepID=A0A6G4WYH7_9ACTN|nr:PP2C family serine/threonine-protein phosphatase [Streptomyces boncukensis]NGO69574.1 serine/threonine-protein phosphatase [Streptomyces boncukensis]
MPQLDRQSACPRCAEPLEDGDRYCGACGADLTALVRRSSGPAATAVDDADEDRPTLPVNGARARARASLPVAPRPGAPAPPEPPAPPVPSVGSAAASAGAAPRTDPRAAVRSEGGGRGGRAGRGAAAAPNGIPSAPPPEGPYGHGSGNGLGDVPSGRSGPEPLGPRCVACGTGTVDDDGYCEHCGHKQPRERDHMECALETVAAASDRGLRHHRNEDYFTVCQATTPAGTPAAIAVVCDGVSSATRPDEASAAAARAAGDALGDSVARGTHPRKAMHDALVTASEAVNALAEDTPEDPARNAPACTIVSALCAGGLLTVGWVGDSRAYWVPDDHTIPAVRLTEDDSWAAQMVAAGLMDEAEAHADARAHAITGWLGADAYELDPHTASYQPEEAGVVVVCTDGLWNYAESAREMAAAVPHDALSRPLHSAQHLVGYALDGGGHDNVTVAVVPFPMPSGRAGSA